MQSQSSNIMARLEACADNSASRPSLVSSFWSLHVHVPSNDTTDLDLRCSSQASLPQACDSPSQLQQPQLRAAKSLSDLQENQVLEKPSGSSTPGEAIPPEPQTDRQERITKNVREWLKRLDTPPQLLCGSNPGTPS